MSERRGVTMMIVWVFIMIAGGLIMLLFFVLASSQAEMGKAKLATQALQQVDSILATQQGSPDTHAQIPIPQSRITLTCKKVEGAILSQIEIGGFARSLRHSLVAGRNLEADQLLLFSKELHLPYDVGNVLMVTSADEGLNYTFEADTPTNQRRFREALPDGVNRIPLQVDASSFENFRVVYFSEDDTPDFSQAPLGAQYIHVQYDNDVRAGSVQYYDNNGEATGPKFHYVGLPMLLAFIWQGDTDRAECLAAKLAERAAQMTDLHTHRMERLSTRAADLGDRTCQVRYGSTGPLDTLKTTLLSTNADDVNTFSGLQTAVQGVENKNEGMLRGVRCATIY